MSDYRTCQGTAAHRGFPAPPCYRVILAVDIERSTTQPNPVKARQRHRMYEIFEETLRSAGIAEHCDPLIDRGDGALALIHPVDQAPKTALLARVVPRLSALLSEQVFPASRLRLRAVLHAGEVHYDGHGCYGQSLDLAFRLLDAPEVKARLRRTAKPLVLVVSEDIYRSLVRHGYAGIDRETFKPGVTVMLAGTPEHGWLHVPSRQADPSRTKPSLRAIGPVAGTEPISTPRPA